MPRPEQSGDTPDQPLLADEHAESPTPPAATPRHASLAQQRSEAVKQWSKNHRTEIASCTASLLSTVTCYPLDTIKTQLQAHKYAGIWDCTKSVYRTDGYVAFYRGLMSPLLSIALVRTFSFTVYQKAKYRLDDWIFRGSGKSPLAIANTHGAYPSWHTVLCFGTAGMTAGAAGSLLACPFELVKATAQISRTNKELWEATAKPGAKLNPVIESYQNGGTLSNALALVRNRGLSGIYSGFHLHLLRDSLGTCTYFITYESCKQFFANARGNSPTTPTAVVLAGGICGLVSWAATYPIDIAKTQYQRNCVMQAVGETEVVRINYFNRLNYKGLGISMIRSASINAIFFLTFESVKKYINRLEVDKGVLHHSADEQP